MKKTKKVKLNQLIYVFIQILFVPNQFGPSFALLSFWKSSFLDQPVKGSPGNTDITASLSLADRFILIGDFVQELQHHVILELVGQASSTLNALMKFHQERINHLEFFTNLSHTLAFFIMIPEGKANSDNNH